MSDWNWQSPEKVVRVTGVPPERLFGSARISRPGFGIDVGICPHALATLLHACGYWLVFRQLTVLLGLRACWEGLAKGRARDASAPQQLLSQP